MLWIIEKGHESVLEVKRASGRVDGIDFHRPNTNLFSNVDDSAQRVEQQEPAESLAMHALVYREAPKQDHWNIDSRQALGLIVGQRFIDDTMSRQGIEAEYFRFASFDGDEGAAQVAAIELPRPLLKPLVQDAVAAVELRPIVLLVKGWTSHAAMSASLPLVLAGSAGQGFIRAGRGIIKRGQEAIPVTIGEHRCILLADDVLRRPH